MKKKTEGKIVENIAANIMKIEAVKIKQQAAAIKKDRQNNIEWDEWGGF